jgi:hypothetical protein
MKSGSYVLNALQNFPSITSLERTPHQMRGLTPLVIAIMTSTAGEAYFSGISSGFVPSSARVLPTVLYFKTRWKLFFRRGKTTLPVDIYGCHV